MPIHNCIQVGLENEYFKEKLTEFYKENKRLKEEVSNLVKQNDELILKHCENLNKKEACSQTPEVSEAPRSSKCNVCKLKSTENDSTKPTVDADIYNKLNKKSYVKLCEMQHNLLKRYEDEVNSNAVKQDLINRMKIELDQLEANCKSYQTELSDLKVKLEDMSQLEVKQKSLVIDLETYKMKCQKYKQELSCFDDTFFNEIEDLKYNYHEAIKLNKYYEQLSKDKELKPGCKKVSKKNNRVKFDLDESNEMKAFSDSIINEFGEFGNDKKDTFLEYDLDFSNVQDFSFQDRF